MNCNDAKELNRWWEESGEESGVRGQLNTRIEAENASRRFYELFSKKSGIHPSQVRGWFSEWNKLPREEAKSLATRWGFSDYNFCAYMAEMRRNERDRN